jgi:hypothetical protein
MTARLAGAVPSLLLLRAARARYARRVRCLCSGWPHAPWCLRSRRARKADARLQEITEASG